MFCNLNGYGSNWERIESRQEYSRSKGADPSRSNWERIERELKLELKLRSLDDGSNWERIESSGT